MAFSESDLRALYCTELSDLAIVNGAPVLGQFTDEFDPGLNMAATAPRLRCMADDVVGVAVGAALRIGTTDYVIRGREPIGDGLEVLLVLERT